jgi:hypothetical protein
MNDTFNTIKANLIRIYIYYIPSKLKEYISKTSFYNMIMESDYDVIAYANKESEHTKDITDSIPFDMIEKAQILKHNIFILFDKKKSVQPNEFSYFLDKYLENLNYYTFIAKWLYSNLSASFPNVKADVKYMFEFQAYTFNKHLQEINKHFGIVDNTPVINEKDILDHFDASFHTEYKQLEPVSENLKISHSKLPIKSKKVKKILVTDEETDAFLLETVFNVKIKKK